MINMRVRLINSFKFPFKLSKINKNFLFLTQKCYMSKERFVSGPMSGITDQHSKKHAQNSEPNQSYINAYGLINIRGEIKPSNEIDEVMGYVHSTEDASMVDGPGVRLMVFTQGCFRRCKFCCNPDTWELPNKKKHVQTSSKTIATMLKRFHPYYARNNGGVTVSGGDPLLQPEFAAAVFQEAHALGLTSVLDTSGYGNQDTWDKILPHTDMVLMCGKAMNPKLHKELTGAPIHWMLEFANAVQEYKIPLVVRYVILPGSTDTKEEIDELIDFCKTHQNFRAIEILPYHRLGVHKYKTMGLEYPLGDLQPPTKESLQSIIGKLKSAGLRTITYF